MNNKLKIAQDISQKYYPSFPTKELQIFASIIEPHTLAKGDVFLEKGQIARDFVYVESGMIRQFYYKKQHDITEHFSCENTLAFCILSLFKKQPTNLMIEALEPSYIYIIPYSKMEELTFKYPHIALLYQRILEWALMLSQKKADSWRFETARERYNRFIKDFPEAAKRASINHIASYLLMTPESLSRVRAGVL